MDAIFEKRRGGVNRMLALVLRSRPLSSLRGLRDFKTRILKKRWSSFISDMRGSRVDTSSLGFDACAERVADFAGGD